MNELKINLREDNSELVLTPGTSEAYLPAPFGGKSQAAYDVLLQVESEHTVTGLSVKMKPDVRDLEGALLVFSFTGDKPNVSDFARFDGFDRSQFDAFLEQREQHGEHSTGFDVTFVDFSYNQVLLALPLPTSHLVKVSSYF